MFGYGAWVHQTSLEELGTPLCDVTFVVVDLETTGGSPQLCRITEIGAVKIRAGDVLGEFATLVNPSSAIPASISALTGITSAMVAAAPPIEAVLPAFLEFCRGAVLVAHNARFDVGFLNANLARLDYPRLDAAVVCTAALARRLVRDEVRNCRLGTLAAFFRTQTEPVHRALADARATVEVFHGLLERAGSFGVTTLVDLCDFAKVRNTPLFAARRGLADGLPSEPGVYAFRSASGEVLYVGKATDLRARVRSYFGSDDRRKIVDLLKEAAQVDHWCVPTPLEAEVLELRLIREHRPRFNRRSKHPERRVWLRLTAERYPRLSIVRRPPTGDVVALGPISSRRIAEQVVHALVETVPIRRCTPRIGARTRFPPCALAEMGRCLAPCDALTSPEEYAGVAAIVAAALAGDPSTVLERLARRMLELGVSGRFEEAAATRDRLRALAAAVTAARRRAAVASAGTLVASRPAGRGRGVTRSGLRDLIRVEGGALTASARVPADRLDQAAAALAAERRLGDPPAPDADEAALVTSWLEGPGVRLHHADRGLALPTAGGRPLADVVAKLDRARRSTGRPEGELSAKRVRRAGAVSYAADDRIPLVEEAAAP